MKISQLLQREGAYLSCEMFPPKQTSDFAKVREAARDIAALRPSFISVTYGAGGGTSAATAEIAAEIQNDLHTTALAHLTCVSSTREQVEKQLHTLQEKGIENVLALRGDIPEGSDFPSPGQYRYASELIGQIRGQGTFCIGAACYPEGHPEAPSRAQDLEYLRQKAESGCDFLTTQMFFDNNVFYSFLSRALAAGVRAPILPGIMPVTNSRQIKRICSLSGTALPARFAAIVDKFSGNPAAMRQAGIAYATEQIIDLIANGVRNIHLYTMNRPDVAGAIFGNLSDILGA